MSEKTITQNEYQAAIDAVSALEWGREVDARTSAQQYVDAGFKAAGITVEPKPVLCGVTPADTDNSGS